jgi:hypothetical protein
MEHYRNAFVMPPPPVRVTLSAPIKSKSFMQLVAESLRNVEELVIMDQG